jgi:hypothetical protein
MDKELRSQKERQELAHKTKTKHGKPKDKNKTHQTK